MIYYAEPSIGYNEIKAVNRILKSKTLTQGNETLKFDIKSKILREINIKVSLIRFNINKRCKEVFPMSVVNVLINFAEFSVSINDGSLLI